MAIYAATAVKSTEDSNTLYEMYALIEKIITEVKDTKTRLYYIYAAILMQK